MGQPLNSVFVRVNESIADPWPNAFRRSRQTILSTLAEMSRSTCEPTKEVKTMKTMNQTKRILTAAMVGALLMAGTAGAAAQTDGPSFDETVERLEREISSIGPIKRGTGFISRSHEIIVSDDGFLLTYKYDFRDRNIIEHFVDIRDIVIAPGRREDQYNNHVLFVCRPEGEKCITRLSNSKQRTGSKLLIHLKNLSIYVASHSALYSQRYEDKVNIIIRALQHLQRLARENENLFLSPIIRTEEKPIPGA